MKIKSIDREAETDGTDDSFKLESYLPYRLAVAASHVTRLMARRFDAAYGVSIAEWRVLSVVARFGVLSPSVVGERTAMDKVKVSRAAASLVARGLLKQSQDPADGRGRLLRLTRKGTSVQQGLLPIVQEIEEELSRGLSRTEWAALQKALIRLDTHVLTLDQPEMAEAAD